MDHKKQCSKCNEIKPLDEYYKKGKTRTGFRAACKTCCNASSVNWTQNNRPRVRTAEKARRAKNKDKINSRARDLYRQNRDRITYQKRERYKARKEVELERAKIYRENNREKILQSQKNYRRENSEKLSLMYKNYTKEYPEKIRARTKARKVRRDYNIPSALDLHHWSYKEDDCLSVIVMSRKAHMKVHTLLEYDKEHFQYRIKESGELLSTREKHLNFISKIVELGSPQIA